MFARFAKWLYFFGLIAWMSACQGVQAQHKHHDHSHVHFTIQSARDGKWSDTKTWNPARVPAKGDRVLITRGTKVQYDSQSKEVIRLIQVVGTLDFARDRSTELNVALLKVQDSENCSESGFACDFSHVNAAGEPLAGPGGSSAALLIGTPDDPISAKYTARVRLHYIEGMNKNDAPAIACCSARMEIHGAPMKRTWLKVAADARPGDTKIVCSDRLQPVAAAPEPYQLDWRVGDEVIITAGERKSARSYRGGEKATEQRRIVEIEGNLITLDKPLARQHSGSGEFRCEVANLSRNVIIESADPGGVRGHTVYHRFSLGGISYARLAHLGKENTLGRYAIHYHLVGDTMRGSGVVGAAIVDSHNRWLTIHGTQYLVVRDCVGYQSVGHGYFMEDGTEVYNLLDRNLGVQAYRGKALPNQVLPFDPNDGAAFWWANGLNTLTRNVGCESDQYGFRYDMQKSSRFDPNLPILQPDGSEKVVDVRTIGIARFEGNEAHSNFAGMVVAANGGRQPDAPIRSDRMLQTIRNIDWTGPDTRHPHVIRDFKIWNAHYAFRPHSPSMLMENVRIHDAAYGIYRPAFENHVYRNLHLSDVGPEPFNRGMDDASAQVGSITVDGLIADNLRGGNDRHPFIHMTDNALAAGAECHFRNVTVQDRENARRPLFNLGGSVRVDPFVQRGVPYFVHDHYGPGRHAKIVSIKAKHQIEDGNDYRQERPLTGDESRVAEVTNVDWPELLEVVDDLPPATVIRSVERRAGKLIVTGVSHDNGDIVTVLVNGKAATIVSAGMGVVDWQLELAEPADGKLVAFARDKAGNVEQTAHKTTVSNAVVVAHSPTAR